MVPLALNGREQGRTMKKKLDGPIAFCGPGYAACRLQRLPCKEFVEKTEAYNAKVKQKLEEQQKNH